MPRPDSPTTPRHRARLLLSWALAVVPLAALAVFAAQVHPWASLLVIPPAIALGMGWELRRDARASAERALEAFANVVDERDHYTAEHSQRVCDLSMLIAREMGMRGKALDRVYWTSRLHDLGKISVDNSILNKPGRLTDAEFDLIKQHPVVSSRVLGSFSFRRKEAEIVLCHHERFDGNGYLKRAAEQVPIESFIIAVADTYDAMTSDRPYRKALSNDIALDEIARNVGTQFHPEPAEAFLNAMGHYTQNLRAVEAELADLISLNPPASEHERRDAA
jgi:HD-GYP domain-containing protein (c-di-GMP phosphodiesterase class II)